ncbi:MAG: hypothetical protein CSA65_02355 [Proteobacteria bacterium]|nr:MAG: hypothetical protein CSA65_02355 [Pseudomonadota bacterium]
MASRLYLLLVAILVATGCGSADPSSTPTSRSTAITDGVLYSGHPSVGRLALNGYDGNTYTCTGTLVGQRTVLTAAHCIKQIASVAFEVGGGSYSVAQTIPHPSYTSNPTRNDIAVLLLSQSPSVSPTPVATRAPWVGLQLTLIGFGITGDGNNDSGVKRMARNSVAEVQPVRINIRGTGGSMGNICNGDSGGPAFATLDGQELQVGVHSYGDALCGVSEWDARVDPFVPWIQQVSGGDVVLPSIEPPDTQAPQVSFGLQNGSQLAAGPQGVELSASDDIGVTSVELVVDNASAGVATQAPYRFNVTLEPGTHTLRARALDAAGNGGLAQITVEVSSSGGPSTPIQGPQVTITWPAAGARVPINATVMATIEGEVFNVTLKVDGALVELKRNGPFDFPVALTPGLHIIEVTAEDPQGNIGTASINVEASQSAAPTTPGGGDIRELVGGCSLARDADATAGASVALLPLLVLLGLLRRSR